MLLRLLFLTLSIAAPGQSIFFGMGSGGGGGGCCCGCGTPQPPSCGCAPACPQPSPCPVCPSPPPCPPPPVAYCPQVQPVYVQSSGGCGGACGGGGGYATAGGGGVGYGRPPISFSAPSVEYPGTPPLPSSAGLSSGGSSGGAYNGHSKAAAAAGATVAQVGDVAEAESTEELVDNAFHSPKAPCVQQIKYFMLKSRKAPGTETQELVEEELEQVQNPIHVEATANPLDSQIGEEIAAQEQAAADEATNDESATSDFKARAAKTAVADEKCNTKTLQNLILSNISANDALASKKAIHENALQQFPDSSVDVICSTTGFTYLVSTTEHCEAQKDGVICFIYKRPL